ncbi:MAG: CehA/McbA family metallohydrolase [Verrucomicrobiota bacterium]|nr:CehA/McbA family metallohydrolase [Verrucomicrobiota bacterium]
MKKPLTCLFCWISLTFYICAKPEAFEVNNALFNELPGGKEADAIVGDFILRNDKVEAVISQNAPFRKANMGTFWGAGGTTQGCLYDLDLRGADNDQITIFAPLGLRGGVSYVRVAEGRPDGESAIETVITAAKGAGMYTKHLYRIRDGWSGVLITTLLRNETKLDRKVKLNDSWTRFGSEGSAGDIRWADSVDPADGRGYAYRWDWKDGKKPGEITLKAGQEITVERFLAVGSSPLSAVGEILKRSGNTGTLSGKVIAADNEKVSGVEIVTEVNGGTVSGYTESDGSFSFSLPKGQAYELSFKDTGRATKTETFDLKSGDSLQKDIRLPSQSAVVFNIKDGNGISIPCKVQFNGSGKTKAPNLGPNNRAHGCVDQYQSERGDFRVPVPSGTYRIVVTHGIEFSHIEREVTVGPGQSVSFEGVLKRVVDTTGWVSTDYHNHSTPSGDNTCGTADRVINMAAEQLEFVPTTEHNRLFDWTPTIASLGLESFMSTVPGIELTGSGAHFNAFPYKPDPRKQDGGAPQWSKDPRLTAITLRHLQDSDPDRWVHINHPSMEENFVDWNGDGLIDGGYANLGSMMDGLETQNYLGNNILAGAPYRIEKKLGPGGRVKYIREFIWLQILNQGHRVWGIAVSDAHTVHGNGAGGWRTYVKSSTDDPPKIDWRELVRNSKSGQMILTNGPYLEVNASGGVLAGGDLRASGGEVNMKIKVQCTDWIDIDRVQVLVNGQQREDLNFTRKDNKAMFLDGTVKFDQEIKVKLNQDAHLIVVAYGEGFNLSKGYGSSTQSAMNPCAYNNPIFVDVDGGGFKPNGDTLGYPLPVKGLTADKVAELLKK